MNALFELSAVARDPRREIILDSFAGGGGMTDEQAKPDMVETQFCDDATAERLEADGWTIRRNALARDHHGHYAPHIAVREVLE